MGPEINLKSLFFVNWSSSIISVPVISLGIKSGVNCIRLNFRSITSATVFIRSVFANPGTPTSKQCPLASKEIRSWSTIFSCPTITLAISVLTSLIFPDSWSTNSTSCLPVWSFFKFNFLFLM